MKWLSQETGISTSMLSDYGRGKTPGADKAVLIADALGTDLRWLLTGHSGRTALVEEHRLRFRGFEPDNATDIVEVHELDLAYGMGGGSYLDLPVMSETVGFARSWLRNFTRSAPDKLFFARGMGDSMMPTILDADIVLIDTDQRSPRMGDQIWAIDYGGVGMIKRLRPMPDGSVKIISDNASVPEELAHDGEMNVIGRVVAIVRKT